MEREKTRKGGTAYAKDPRQKRARCKRGAIMDELNKHLGGGCACKALKAMVRSMRLP